MKAHELSIPKKPAVVPAKFITSGFKLCERASTCLPDLRLSQEQVVVPAEPRVRITPGG